MHADRPPDVEALLALLAEHNVRFVVVGSVAALLRGVELTPGDLDVVPATDRANLERLIAALEAAEARPPGPFGEWRREPGGRWKWHARPTTPEEVVAWRPDADDLATLDQLYRTRHGNLDVVPLISGTYEELAPRAERLQAYGRPVLVPPSEDLLARLESVERKKDGTRIEAIRQALSERTAIRPARPADLPDIFDLLRRQFTEHGIAVEEAALRRSVEAVLADGRLGFFLLATRGAQPIGVAYVSFLWSLEHGGRSLWLDELFVVPEERSRGVGGALLDEVLRRAREAGCAAVDLEVEHALARAENLYRRAGFVPHTRTRWVRRLGDPAAH